MKKKLITIALSSALALSTVSVGVSENLTQASIGKVSISKNATGGFIGKEQSTTNSNQYTFTLNGLPGASGTWYIDGAEVGSGQSLTYTFAHSGPHSIKVNWSGFVHDRPQRGSLDTSVNVKPVTPTTLGKLTEREVPAPGLNVTSYDVTANIQNSKAQAKGWKYSWVYSTYVGDFTHEANVVGGVASTSVTAYEGWGPSTIYLKAVSPDGATVLKSNTLSYKFEPVEQYLKIKTQDFYPGTSADNFLISVSVSNTIIDPQSFDAYFVVNGEKQKAHYSQSTNSYVTNVTVIAPGYQGAGSKTVQFVAESGTMPGHSHPIKTIESNKEVFKYKSSNLPTKVTYTLPSQAKDPIKMASTIAQQIDANQNAHGKAHLSVKAEGNAITFKCDPGYHAVSGAEGLAFGKYNMPEPIKTVEKSGSMSIGIDLSGLSMSGFHALPGLYSYGVASNGGKVGQKNFGDNDYSWVMGCTK